MRAKAICQCSINIAEFDTLIMMNSKRILKYYTLTDYIELSVNWILREDFLFKGIMYKQSFLRIDKNGRNNSETNYRFRHCNLRQSVFGWRTATDRRNAEKQAALLELTTDGSTLFILRWQFNSSCHYESEKRNDCFITRRTTSEWLFHGG